MQFTYKTKGVCSQQMEIETEGDTVTHVRIIGGCDGNGQGVARLVEGMPVDDVISRLEGIRCGFKNTSCPDQLAHALKIMRSASSDGNT